MPDTDDSVSSIGDELHNYATSLYYSGNEDIAYNLEEIAIRLWKYKPDTRITIQDAREIVSILLTDYRDEYCGQSIDSWIESCEELLLNKLNAKQE